MWRIQTEQAFHYFPIKFVRRLELSNEDCKSQSNKLIRATSFSLSVDHLCGWSKPFRMIYIYISSRSYGWKIIGFEGYFLIHHVVANWMVLVDKQIWTSLYHLINRQMINKTHDFSSITSREHKDHIERSGPSIHT